MARAIVWDNHACMPLRPGDTRFLTQLERYRTAGVTAVTLNVSMDMIPWPQAFKLLASFRAWVRAHADHYLLGDSVAAIEEARASGRLAVLFDLEGGAAVDDHPDLVEAYYALGVRWMLVAYNRRNRLGSGCQVALDEGLTKFGRSVIDAMNRVGMIVCCSHTGERTAFETIDYNLGPTIFSHSNPAGVQAHARNISDRLIRACAAKGGVIGLVGFGPFVSEGQPSVERLADMADYLADLVGPDHIGLGLDYVFDPSEGVEFATAYPDWFGGFDPASFPSMLGPEAIPALAERLLRRGWTETAVEGVLGLNLVRVARRTWQ